MGQGTRQSELHRRRTRKVKLRAMRERFGAAKSSTEKEAVIAKVARLAPWLTADEFKATAKKA
jgi:hypothetical protein